MQHFDMDSTVFERRGSVFYIFVKKSFSKFLTFFPILAYISLSASVLQPAESLSEWTFQNFICIFLKINFFNSTTLNAHNSAKNKNRARNFLLVSFCREFHLV